MHAGEAHAKTRYSGSQNLGVKTKRMPKVGPLAAEVAGSSVLEATIKNKWVWDVSRRIGSAWLALAISKENCVSKGEFSSWAAGGSRWEESVTALS